MTTTATRRQSFLSRTAAITAITAVTATVGCDTDDASEQDSSDTESMSDDAMPDDDSMAGVELPQACADVTDVLRLDTPRYGEPADDVCDTEGAPLGTFGTEGTLNRPWVCLGDLNASDKHRDLLGGSASGGAPTTYMGMYTYDNADGEPSYIAALVTDHGFTWVSKCVASSPASGDSIIDTEDRDPGDPLCEGIGVSVGEANNPGLVVFESDDGPCALTLQQVSGFPG